MKVLNNFTTCKLNPISDPMRDPVMKTIVKYKAHPSIITKNEIKSLKINKSIQSTNSPTRLIKEIMT